MRRLFLATLAAGIALSSLPAFADSWRARATLDPTSPFLCRQADVTNLFIEFTQTGNELAVRTPENGFFSVPIAADGSVAGAIAVPVGDRKFAVDLTGNARNRDLNVYSRKYSCRFLLSPTG